MALPVTTGLVAHLDPATITANDGDAITSYPAVGGTTAWTVQGTGPIYREKGQRANPYLEHHASGSTGLRWNQDISAGDSTVFVVARQRGTANARILSGITNNWLLGWHNNTEDDHYAVGWVLDSTVPATTRLHAYVGRRYGTYSTFWRDGVQLAHNTLGTAGPNGLTTNGYIPGNSEYSDSDVYEVIVYNRTLTFAEVDEVNGYLRDRHFPRPLYRDVVLASSPMAYWRLGEAAGTTAADEMGSHPGTYGDGVTLGVNGVAPPDTAIQVTAPGVATVADSAALQAAHPGLTVEAWLRQSSRPTDWTYAVHRNNSWAIGDSVYALAYDPNGNLVWSVGGNYIDGTSTTKMADGGWHHVVGTWDGATARLYLDGRLIHSYAQTTLGNKAATTTIGGHAFEATNPGRGFVGRLDEVAIYDRVLTPAEVDEHFLWARSMNNILDYSTWAVGQGSVPGFNANGDAVENQRIIDRDPAGRSTVVWEARPDATSGADGGWNGDTFPIDPTKTYRLSVWIRRTVLGNGSAYFGTHGYGPTNGVALRDTGAIDTNPYFWSGAWPHPVNTWVLLVGHVWPAGSGTGSNKPDSGMYAADGTYLGAIHRDFVWLADTATSRHRAYLYYSTDTTTRQQFLYPRMEVVDGTEPSVGDLIADPPFPERPLLPTYPKAVLRDEPVGYWRLGEKSGTTAIDSSANASDGTYQGTPVLGQPGALPLNSATAVNFDGEGDHFVAPNPKVMPGEGSIEAWVHTGTWEDTGRHGIFQNIPTWNNAANSVGLFRWAGSTVDNGLLYFRVVSPTGTLQDLAPAWTSVLVKNAWNHVVGTWNATTMHLYVNGRLVSGPKTITPPNTFPSTNVFWAMGHGYTLRGLGDEFALYDYALSAPQVRDHYGSPSPYRQRTMRDRPVGYWRLADKGASALDEVRGSNGAATGDLVPGQDGPVEGTGSTQFNAGYFTITNAPHLQVVGNQTIEMWLRPDNFSARRNPINKAYGGEFTMTQETAGNINYFWGTAGADTTPYQGVGSTAVLTVGQWHHIAVVRDLDAMTIKWYIDGVKTNEVAASYAAAVASTANILIGDGYVEPYNGRIAELALYNRALPEATIQSRVTAPDIAPTLTVLAPANYVSLNDATPELTVQVTAWDEGLLDVEFQLFEAEGIYSDIYDDVY